MSKNGSKKTNLCPSIRYAFYYQHPKLLNPNVLQYPDLQSNNKLVNKSHDISFDTLRPGEIENTKFGFNMNTHEEYKSTFVRKEGSRYRVISLADMPVSVT